MAWLERSAIVRRIPLHLPRWAELIPLYAIGSVAMFWVAQRIAAFEVNTPVNISPHNASRASPGGRFRYTAIVCLVANPGLLPHDPQTCETAKVTAA